MSKQLVSFLFGFVLVCAQTSLAQLPGSVAPASPSEDTAVQAAYSLSAAFERVANITTPSLVNISSVKRVSGGGSASPRDLEPFREFFGDDFIEKFFPDGKLPQNKNAPKGKPRDRFSQNGMGTGFVVDEEGHILTNNHVIADADEVQVTFADDKKYKATIVGRDERTDLAVLKIDAKNLKPLGLGDSDTLKIGEWVIAAGSPFGLSNSITAGIVSAKGRSIMGGNQYEDFIQTDAAINPGNSGGPLLNLKGEVVGVNTAIYSRSGGYMGIGFAIPSSMVKQIMQSLIKTGKVSRGWLGVVIQPLSDELKAEFKFAGDHGILIGDVSEDGPAAKAGLQEGDIVVSLNGKPVKEVNQFRNMVAAIEPGTTVEIGIFRAGAEKVIKARLGELEKDSPQQQDDAEELDEVGLTVQNLTDEVKMRLGTDTKGNVIVTAVEAFSPAAESGVQVNDIIIKAAGEAVKNADHFYELMKKADITKGVLLIVESSGMKRFIVIKKAE